MTRACLLALACTALLAGPVRAQRVAVEFLFDGELWKTDSASRLLARNGGEPAIAGRARSWLAIRAGPKVDFLAHVMAEAGSAENEDAVYLEQLEVKARAASSLTIEAGKILQPIGTFGTRRFSNTNPLIGEPDAYPAQYPWGAVATGVVAGGRFDYHVALTSLPAVNERYTPPPDDYLRPIAGIGVSVGPAFRIGATATHGPYLGDSVSAQLPSGRSWKDYKQTVVAGDVRFSKGYIEARAEASWSEYEVPTVTDPLHGFGWYAELRGTVSPRVFLAGRYEYYRYAFVLPVNQTFWVGRETTQMNAEVGMGYRVTSATLLKTTVRRDHWPVHTIPGAPSFPDGWAVAIQCSVFASATDLLAGGSRY
ncbi:MAG: hypothetical protein DMD54_10720 [Gemmatimonadetes bacterium]|nr:MAG: hypothetical protein DMD54_10720 [Gemmatimonadota bacterium]